MHDFNYASLVSDFIGINEHKEVEVKTGAGTQMIRSDDEEEKESFRPLKNNAKTRQHKLDWTDKVWYKYKGKHFADAMKNLSSDLEKFSREHSDVAKLRKGDNMELSETVDLLRKMPKYQELTIQFTTHLEMV